MNLKSYIKPILGHIPFTWRIPPIYYKALNIGNGITSRESIERWQLDHFKAIFEYAYKNVPGYYELYHNAGIAVSDIQTINDIQYVPIVDKDLIRDNLSLFVSKSVPERNRCKCTTSGSTGTPFSFYRTRKEEWIEQAFVAKWWSEGGYNLKQSGIVLRGAYSGDIHHIFKKCDNWFFYAHNGSYMLSPNYMEDSYYALYSNFLRMHAELTYIFALPSSITLLSKMLILNNDIDITGHITAIYLSSETLYEWEYLDIKKAFPNATVISLYGMSERTIMACWCSKSRKYHIDPFYGYTEVLNGHKPVCLGCRGELVGTSFWAETTPFIRYRTKDMASISSKSCSECGKQFDIIDKIDGREQDVLVGYSGRKVLYTVFDGTLMHGNLFRNIIRFRIVQKLPGHLHILIIPNPLFSSGDLCNLNRCIKDYLGADFNINLEIVDSLPSSGNGKFNIVEQHINIDKL